MARTLNGQPDQAALFLRNVQRGIEKGMRSLSTDQAKITYRCSRDYTVSFKDPEEKVTKRFRIQKWSPEIQTRRALVETWVAQELLKLIAVAYTVFFGGRPEIGLT